MNKEEEESETQNQNPNSNAANPNDRSQGSKVGNVKSCKGCLYYSLTLKSKSRGPTCVGIPKTLQQRPSITGEFELGKGHTTDFHYACVGYSVHLDDKDSSTRQSDKHVKLPSCFGFEVLLLSKDSEETAATDHVPANIHKNKDNHILPLPQTINSTESEGHKFFNRFIRNAGIVASGVAKNLNKVGNNVKKILNDILFGRSKQEDEAFDCSNKLVLVEYMK
ncbi:hypothetical protein DITRI_Ditri01bG0044400 [Diplodiscus trichospermus]